MTYGYLKDLTSRKVFDKIIRDKAFTIVKNTKFDGYRRGLALMVYTFFIKNLYVVVLKYILYQTNN